MAYYHLLLAVMMLKFSWTECSQPCQWTKANGNGEGVCPFRIRCINAVHNIIREDCQGSQNNALNTELILDNAIDKLIYPLKEDDIDFLGTVTFFKMNTGDSFPNLDILDHMNRLRHLDLSHNYIKQINGTPFYNLFALENLYISKNRLSDIDGIFQFEMHPNKLKILSLAHNNIHELVGSSFEELSSLKELDLSYNHILDLTEEPFMNLTSLEILRLNNNNIKDLNGAFNNLLNLKRLFLNDNQIESINSASLKIIYDLETFDISGNQLDDLGSIMFSRHWGHFGDKCRINVSNNRINLLRNASSYTVPARYTRHLREYAVDVSTELDLSKNSIENIEYNAFHSIVRLINLDLSHNKIEVFNINPSDLMYLEFLNLSTNSITLFHLKSFSSLPNLQNLDLSYNSLDKIPEYSFENNMFLKYVNMTHNYITQVQALRIKMFHPEGGVLDLSNNGLSELNIPTGQGLRLTNLILHSNKIIDPSRIKLNHRQIELKVLDLSKNLIEGLKNQSLQLPYSLSYLDLSFNKISYIKPGVFSTVNYLKTLRLSHNHINTLEFGIFLGLNSLKNLDLSYNNIKQIDSKVFIDLKSMEVLSLKFNYINYLDYNVWLGQEFDVKVFIEGNNISCQWLGTALTDYKNGISKMKLESLSFNASQNSLGGIQCLEDKMGRLIDGSSLYDEKLLVTSQKILEAVKEQTSFIRTILLSYMNYNPKTYPVQNLIGGKK